MKSKALLFGLSAISLVSSASADVTVNITGATAFRAAALDSIKASYLAEPLATRSFKFAYDATLVGTSVFNSSTRAIFIGKFPGITGITTIRCCFTGSVEGIKALAVPADTLATYYQPALLSGVTATATGAELSNQGTTGVANAPSQLAFSDVTTASTPFGAAPVTGAQAGVIVFTMLTNKGSAITNVTTQQFKALFSNGFQPLSLFTGNVADDTLVFATGRNDGSGTRTTYLAETGFGITNTVRQYVANVTTSTTLSTIQLVPPTGVNTPALPGQSASNASTVWGQSVAGNGGYNSGSALRGDMGKTGTAVTVLDEAGADAFGGAIRADLVTWLSVNDAVPARVAGAVFCGYNGVRLDQLATSGTSINDAGAAADKAKVTNGAYTAWGYENLYRRNDTTADQTTVYSALLATIPNNLAAAGIAYGDMAVNRSVDGGLVSP